MSNGWQHCWSISIDNVDLSPPHVAIQPYFNKRFHFVSTRQAASGLSKTSKHFRAKDSLRLVDAYKHTNWRYPLHVAKTSSFSNKIGRRRQWIVLDPTQISLSGVLSLQPFWIEATRPCTMNPCTKNAHNAAALNKNKIKSYRPNRASIYQKHIKLNRCMK